VSPTQLAALIPAAWIASPGTAAIGVTVPNQQSPPSLQLSIVQGPVLTSLAPPTTLAGGAEFKLTANGSGFAPGATLLWNGAPLVTTFVNVGQLAATVPANLIAQVGQASVTVTSNNQTSNSLPFTITAGPVTITSISPSTVPPGGPPVTLTVNGANFAPGAVVSFNTTTLSTTFVSPIQVTAQIPAALIAQTGTAQITLANPTGVASNAVILTIALPAPTISSIAPSTVPAGNPAFTLTVSGTDFFPGVVVSFGSAKLTTTFGSSTQVTASVPADLIAKPATASITAANVGTASSNAVSLAITTPPLSITSISPNSVTAGGPQFTLTVNGVNFISGATVQLDNAPLATTFVSSTQLTAIVPASRIQLGGARAITAQNPDGSTSNAVNLTVTAPPPVISTITPSTVAAGGEAFTLTVNGSGFVAGATVSLNATSLSTTFVNAGQLTASVPAALIAQAGSASITAANPGGAASNAVSLAITAPLPVVTGITPPVVTAGGPGFTLVIKGTGFLPGALVTLNETPLATTVDGPTQVSAIVPGDLISQPGTLRIIILNPGGTPVVVATLIVMTPSPMLSLLSATGANVGDAPFTLSLNGSGFIAASVVQWDGVALPTTFISNTELRAVVSSALLATPGTIRVTVVNPVPDSDAQTSNALTFTVGLVTPVLTSMSPASANAGDAAFTLTLTGSGFLPLTIVRFNGTALVTHFVSTTQLTADVPASLLAGAGDVPVTAVNPGNVVSAALTFTIRAQGPATLTSLSRTSAIAGDAAFTLTLNGANFGPAAVVNWGRTALATTVVSATQMTAAVPASLLAIPGTVQIAVQQNGATSNALSFTVNLPPPPSLRLNAPPTATATQQISVDLGLNAGYPLPLTGTVTVSFASNSTVPRDDTAIQLATGGRTLTFIVPPNTTTVPALLLQTGTTAGSITLKVTLTAAGIDVTPAGATATIAIPRSAPVIRTVTLVHASDHLEVDLSGFSSTLDVSSATFQFKDASGNPDPSAPITVQVGPMFTTWFQSATAATFGSQFTYAQPFTVSGDSSRIVSVTVTLTNSAGTSAPATSQ
jgi:hypothetical protein